MNETRLSQLDFSWQGPRNLFDATVIGTTPNVTLWPGTLGNTLPSGPGKMTNIFSAAGGSSVCGGVFQTDQTWGSVLLNFAVVGGAAAQTLTVEIGQVLASPPDPATSGNPQTVGIAETMDSAALTSSTKTIANANPFTGRATAGVTWRLMDVIIHTNKTQLGQVLTSLNGSVADFNSEIALSVSECAYYYVLVTNLGAGPFTRVLCNMRPV